MDTQLSRSALAGLLLGGAVMLGGCPSAPKQAAQPAAPAPQIRRNTANDNAGGKQLVDSNQFQVNKPAQGAATAPPAEASAAPGPPNPHPQGDNWVFTPQLMHHIGDKLSIEYTLATPNPGKAWIAVVPAATTATDEPGNDAVDVNYTYLQTPKTATVELTLPKVGTFKLRLFGGNDAADKMLAESPVLTVSQWPKGDLAAKTPPYVTLSAHGAGPVEVMEGAPLVATFVLPPGYPDKAWLGVIPADTASQTDGDNDAVDVDYIYLTGKQNDTYTWKDTKPGKYVVRIFPCSETDATLVAESEPFTVKPLAQ